MKSISHAALAAFLALGTAAATPALAQDAPAAPQAPAPTPITPSKGAQKPILALQSVVDAKDEAGYPAALAAAQAAAKTADDRYAIARIQLTRATNLKDVPGQISAVEAMIANAGERTVELSKLYSGLAGLHFSVKNLDQAGVALEKLIALDPANTDSIWKLAELRYDQKNYADAFAQAERAIKIAKGAGQSLPANWYARALQFAYEGKLGQQSLAMARELVSAEPTPQNWRNALLIYRAGVDLDASAELDLLRLMRSAKALDNENDVYKLAAALDQGNFPAEAEAVINEAAAAGKINASKPLFGEVLKRVKPKIAEDKAALPGLEARARSEAGGRLASRLADGWFGHQDYAKAAELYRLALQKGSVDANQVNTRLGIALALAGRKAEAEAAFKAVSGPRQGLADFWLLWLSQSS